MEGILKRPTVFAVTATIGGVFEVFSFLGIPPFNLGATTQTVGFLVFALSLLRIIALQREELNQLREPDMVFDATSSSTPQTSAAGLPVIMHRIGITNKSKVTAKDCELFITSFSAAVQGLSMDTALNVKDLDRRKTDISRESTKHFDLFMTYTGPRTNWPNGTFVLAPNMPSIPWEEEPEGREITLRLTGSNFEARTWRASVRLQDGGVEFVGIQPLLPNT